MILFFDTETTGVPVNYRASYTDTNNWPRLVQLGFIAYEDGIEKQAVERIVKPDGFAISEQVSNIHGVTQSVAETFGTPLKDVLTEFSNWLQISNLLVGHNLSFDLNILGAEYYRLYSANPLVGRADYDTMLRGVNLCKLPGRRMGEYKWPKLQELYFRLFNEPLAQTHTALDDIRQTAKCYFEMQRLGIK